MSFETLAAFEDVYAHMQEQLAVLTMFVDTFATKDSGEDLVRQIHAQKSTFLCAAALLHGLTCDVCKSMDAAIAKAYTESTAYIQEAKS